MRKALAAAAITTALSTVPVFGSVSAQEASPPTTANDSPVTEAVDEAKEAVNNVTDDNGGDDSGKWGLLGLIGLLGLAGLAGLRRKDHDRGTGTTVSGTAPRTAEGASSSDPNRLP